MSVTLPLPSRPWGPDGDYNFSGLPGTLEFGMSNFLSFFPVPRRVLSIDLPFFFLKVLTILSTR